MQKKITDYIKESQKLTLIQAKIPVYLAEEVRDVLIRLKKQGKKANWNTLLEACLTRFCVENKER